MEDETNQQFANQQKLVINNLGQISKLKLQEQEILYYKNPTILNQKYSKDIIPGVYEGGFQLWECEIQFIKKMFSLQQLKISFQGKSVAQIGCGHGLIAIAAHKLGASLLTLQDYNENVIKQLTIPTLHLNNIKQSATYLWGDWDSISNAQGYDIILGSQVTYKQENYQKIINFINRNMKKSGKCILANKTYYFGVGGNLPDFKENLEKNGLQWKVLQKIVPKSGGNKKQIIEITFKDN